MTPLFHAQKNFLAFGWQRAAKERMNLFAAGMTYLLVLVVYSAVFKATPFADSPGTLSAPQMIWYMTLTELVIFSSEKTFRDVREDASSGDYTVFLQRPFSYLSVKSLEWGGRAACYLIFYTLLGFTFAYLATGLVPFPLQSLPFILLSLWLGCILYNLLLFSIGVLEIWGAYSRPSYWILQKFVFLFGGLILPLQLYPDMLKIICWATPFPAILSIPAKSAFGFEFWNWLGGFAIQLIWLPLVSTLAFFMHNLVNKTIMKRGY